MVGAPGEDTAPYYKIKALPCARAISHGSTPAPYDLLVIGGGIHGLAIAYEAAQPRPAHRARRGGATSAAAPRSTIRRPRTAACARCSPVDLARARESIRERRALARIAPWFLRPLPFLVGTYRSVPREPARAARRLQVRRLARTPPQRGRRAGAASAGAAARVEGGDAAAVPRHPPGRADRRRAVVRLPDGRGRSADVRVRRRRGSRRRRSRQLRRSDRRRSGTAAGSPGMTSRDRADRRARSRSRARVDGQRGRRARRRDHARSSACPRPFPLVKAMNLVTSKPASDMALAAPARDRPDADAGAVARPRARRHQPVRRPCAHRDDDSGHGRAKSTRSSPRPTPRSRRCT